MRNIYIKTTAFILSIIFAALMTYTGCVTVFRYAESYDFTKSFENSWLSRAYLLESIYNKSDFDGIEYYIKSGEDVYTNNNISDKDYYRSTVKTQAACLVHENKEATVIGMWELKDGCSIYAKLTDAKYTELEIKWKEGEAAVRRAVNICIICFAGMLAALVYLLWTCGRKNGSDVVHTILIDRMPTEITLALLALSSAPIIGAAVLISNEYSAELFSAQADIIAKLASLGAVVSYALAMMFLLSLVRNLKNKTFLKQSIIFRLVRFAWNLFVKIVKKIFSLIKRAASFIRQITMIIFDGNREILLFIVYSMAVFILTMIFTLCTDGEEWLFPFALLAVTAVAALRYVYKRIVGFKTVCEGARKIRSGDIGYVIPTECGDARTTELADNINRMADGLRESVEREVRAERMKAELITNVSHDLKTPLTAIINYADLLSAQKLSPDEANDYVAVIKKKGERLKKLTNDLFDISKANNGAEQVNLEKIDLALLIRQSLGELDESIKKSGLDFRVNIPDGEVNVTADGKKMSRVFENLIANILKYSMDKSRVYINLSVRDGAAHAEFKNISAYPMDFDGDYITERFARGDKSRTSEGSGLGLAIAKSYTELCGGTFGVTVDGDLFKASVRLTLTA